MKVFSVFDSKAKAFLQPFFCVNAGVAVRSFSQAAQDKQGDFHRFASDFTLFEIGSWDETQGSLKSHESKVSLGVASQFLSVDESAEADGFRTIQGGK